MSDFHISIKGLALCRPVGSMTQILFPHAPGHTLKFSIDNGIETVDEEISLETYMEMRSEPGVISIDPPTGTDNDLTDLNDLHNRFTLPSFTLKNRDDVKSRISVSYLSIPTSVLYSSQLVGRPYEVWVKKSGGARPERQYLEASRTFAEEVDVSFRIPPEDLSGIPAIILDVAKPFGRSYTFVDTVDPDNPSAVLDYKITFDNHCHSDHSDSCGSDFGYYYEILKAVDQVSQISYEIEEFEERRRGSFAPDSIAACNPVLGDPKTDLGTWHTP